MSNEIKTRPLTPTEQKYTYAQSMQLEGQTGTIGHLRGDFATTGYGFYTTWFDTRPQWKSDEFKADLDTVINALREDKGLLHIVERFNLASVDTASIVTEAEKSKDAKDGQSEPDIGVQEKAEKDKLLDELMGKPVQKEENAPNPSVAKTEKSPQSEPTLEQPKKSAEGATMTKEKPSVREELRKIKESRKEQEAEIGTSDLDKSGASDRAKSANRKTEHKQPTRKKKKPKSKETR